MPTARRALSTWRSTRSPPVVAPRPSSCSTSPIRSSVCLRPSVIRRCTRSSASLRVIRPRLTASSTTSWMRSPVSMTPFVSVSRRRLSRAVASSLDGFGAARLVVDARLAVVGRLAVVERLAEDARLVVDAERFVAVPCFLGCGIRQAYSAVEQELQQGLLGVAAILRLVPNRLARAVQNRLGDLLARVGREAVQRDRAVGGAVEQGVVDPVGRERSAPLVGGALVAHGDPDV